MHRVAPLPSAFFCFPGALAGCRRACGWWSGRFDEDPEFGVAVLVLPQVRQAVILQAQAAVDVAGRFSAGGAGLHAGSSPSGAGVLAGGADRVVRAGGWPGAGGSRRICSPSPASMARVLPLSPRTFT